LTLIAETICEETISFQGRRRRSKRRRRRRRSRRGRRRRRRKRRRRGRRRRRRRRRRKLYTVATRNHIKCQAGYLYEVRDWQER